MLLILMRFVACMRRHDDHPSIVGSFMVMSRKSKEFLIFINKKNGVIT